jgi:hypothetical protein
MREMPSAYKILIGKPEVKRALADIARMER